jgi:hypothetical protein
MKKSVLVLILGIALLAAFGPEAQAQIPKEGTSSATWAFCGPFKAIPMGQERIQMTYEVMGVAIGETSEDLFHNASFRCLGALHAVKGKYDNNRGFCVSTRPDGDQVFFTYEVTGELGRSGKGTTTIVGGTGKLTGIQGNFEYTQLMMRPSAEGTLQGYNRGKGHYKLP